MNEPNSLTITSILAAASEAMLAAKYSRVPEERVGAWPLSDVRVFEDPYSVVAVVAYDAWDGLVRGWTDAQGSLVEMMSSYVTQSEAKAWDGYLVLLTLGDLSGEARVEAAQIERDTSRVRKLVATGEDLRTLDDVERTLLPLLPVETPPLDFSDQQEVLGMLPRLLAHHGVPEGAARTLVGAFAKQEPLLERLHVHRTGS